ncbi:hypothetical protein OF83DRAFT_1169733 [Amylostereum chailletii]|nr:hypothetical protein OF83DRAFT_1169733 [Amylostereum chailletii]
MSTADPPVSQLTVVPFIPAIILQAGLFGAYTLLIVQSTYVLLRKDLRLRSIQWMLGVTSLMYITSAIHLGSGLYSVLSSFRPGRSEAAFISRGVAMLGLIFSNINLLLSDAVVVWRAWILWERNKFVLTSCSVLFTATLAMAGFTIYQQSVPDSGSQNLLESQYGLPNATTSAVVVSLSLSLAANLWSTALIAYKAWHYRRSIAAHLQRGDKKNMVEKLLTLLLESGAIYSCIQAAFVVSFALSPQSESSITLKLFTSIIPQISGIYPTIIIVLVCFQKTHCDRQFTYPDVEVEPAGARRGLPGQDLTAFEVSARSEPVIIVGPGANMPLAVYSDSESILGDVGVVKSEAWM